MNRNLPSRTLIAFVLISLVGCSHPDDIYHTDNSKIGKVKTVLILGNSIVRHKPAPEIGWKNDWGMAASSIDSDFVHILIRRIHEKDTSARVAFKNIADFETHYQNYDFHNFDSVRDLQPDIIVMRIAENVTDSIAIDRGFIKKYGQAVKYLNPSRKAIVVTTDGFWRNNHVNRLIHDFAKDQEYTFLKISDTYNENNTAKGLFENPGIQAHPGNRGMRAIADRIWKYLRIYF